ncbi:MAG: TolC family protein [Dysgonamonadaceae bacterium]|jgi:outer membrane protein TolC|nr:TolC family protein [Dysgonamonadaceae bacterium]
MKKTAFLLGFIAGLGFTAAAQLTIEDCLAKARENYPAVRQYDLIGRAKDYTLANAAKAFLPQFHLNLRASYQSDVTSVPVDIPGLEIPSLNKDQYQAVIEANQVLWDGGAVRAQKKQTDAGAEVEVQQLEVELYALRERVHQLFFGILLLDVRLEQNRVLREELDRNFSTISGYVAYGTAHAADLDAVQVEQLQAKQAHTQLIAGRKAYVEMLGRMIGENPDASVALEKPAADWADAWDVFPEKTNRPELRLFDAQENWYDSQQASVRSAAMPKAGLFLQGGAGRPGLNMLAPKFDFFYIGGIRLSWNFGALYTRGNDLRKIGINRETVAVRRAIFLYNLQLLSAREHQEIRRLQEVMKQDDEIIRLRENIRKSAEAKVANGTLTAADLMRELGREHLARQTKATHEIDLLAAIFQLNHLNNP